MNRRSNEEWNSIIDDQKSSGLSIAEYCKQNHINTGSFYKHKKLLVSDHNNINSNESNENQFFPVKLCDYDDKISFTLDGHIIECDRKDINIILGGLI